MNDLNEARKELGRALSEWREEREGGSNMKIVIETVPHSAQRYNTVGDWQDRDDACLIRVSRTGNWRYDALIAIHELVEVVLCRHADISSWAVDEWDREHKEAGDDPAAPYHRQHMMADAIERLIALELGVRWDIYEAVLDKL